MKTRVTFRVAEDLAEALRSLPNQTQFVEVALRDALGITCPTCAGSGRISGQRLRVQNFRRAALPRLDRQAALRLKSLVSLARRLGATELDLARAEEGDGLHFSVLRGDAVLLSGDVGRSATRISTPSN